MKLLYTSDLHGNEAQYARLVSLAGRLRPGVIVLGGDMLPDDSALEPQKMGAGQAQFVRSQFRKWAENLQEASGGAELVVIFGNHDWGCSAAAMRELAADHLVRLPDLKHPSVIDGVSFVGYPCCPPTPWFVKDFERLDEPGDELPLLGGARWDARFSRPACRSAKALFAGAPTIRDELSALAPPGGAWVFVCHAPPYESNLDRHYDRSCWGSRAVRSAIQTHQPLVSLHGHIHQSPEVTGACEDRIGSTIAVNPGQSPSKLHYSVIEIDPAGERVTSIQHGHYA